MRFMMMYKPGREERGPPSAEHVAAMNAFIEEGFRSGVLLLSEGLQPSARGAKVRLTNGETTVTDGPFAEAKEIVGGFAIVNASSKTDAIEIAKRFLRVAGEGVTEVRQLFEQSDFAAA
jgi:hypothetical protein